MTVLMDGGMGQELLRRSGAEPTPLWSAQVMMDRPELVEEIHLDTIRAGARLITVNAYSATRCRLEPQGAGDRFEALQTTACEIACRARDRSGDDVTIAGCLPPLKWSYRPDLAEPSEVSAGIYAEIAALQSSFVDLFLCETMGSADEGKGAALGASSRGKPVWVSWTLNDDDRGLLRSGENLAEANRALNGLPVAARLVNCSIPEAVTAAMPSLKSLGGPVGAYANGFSGISPDFGPNTTVKLLDRRRDLGPREFAEQAMGWVAAGAAIVGGCCEIGPEHIAELARRLDAAGHTIRGTIG